MNVCADDDWSSMNQWIKNRTFTTDANIFRGDTAYTGGQLTHGQLNSMNIS